MFRRHQLLEIGLYDEAFRWLEERELRRRFEKKFKIARLAIPLYRYSQHETNITNDKAAMKKYEKKLAAKFEEKSKMVDPVYLGKKYWTRVPFLIAEIGVNHEGSIEKAHEMIEEAAANGADAAKFQTYKAENLAAKNSPAYWDLQKEPTQSQRELFKKYDSFSRNDYIQLSENANSMASNSVQRLLIQKQLKTLIHWFRFSKLRQQI